MRTDRLLPISRSMHCSRGGGVPAQGECTCLGGVPAWRVPPPWTEFLTHANENITLPQTSFAGGN